jgi:hypothetical protein
MNLPNVDWRFSFAQEVGQILLGLESTISFQEVEARDFFMSAIKYVQEYTILTNITSPIRRFLDQAITPAVGVRDPQSVNDVWTWSLSQRLQAQSDTSEGIDDVPQTLPL